jgi:hypothetical protein
MTTCSSTTPLPRARLQTLKASKVLKCLFSFVTVAGEMGVHHRRKREGTSSNGNIQTSEQIAIRHGNVQRERREPMHLTSVPYLTHTLGPLPIPP